jgi:glycosyltransferase involved in cell wall biosynthesis
MSSPRVSIITPTKNRLALLCQAMDSVAAQSFENWEHLVVDDGSDDGSIEEIHRRAKADSRIRLHQREGEKSGGNVCRNLGISKCRGEYVVFLDSDDLLIPSCLEKRLALIERNADLDFVTYLSGRFVDKIGDRPDQEKCEVFGDDLLRFLYFEHPWIITSPIWRTKSLHRLSGFDETLPSWQDVDLHIRAVCAGMNYLRIPEIDHQIRWLAEDSRVSVTQRKSPKHLAKAIDILEKFERTVREGPGMDWSRQRALCSLYFFLAECWIEQGNLLQAIGAWGTARGRRLLPYSVYMGGVMLLCLKRVTGRSELVRRVIGKWIGIVRLRRNAELVK